VGGVLAALLTEGAEQPAGLAPPGYLTALLQMVGALLLVCVLAYVVLRGLRRVAGRRGPTGSVRVLERCPLSPRHSLWVVEIGERCLLLGSSDSPGGPLTRLAELDRAALGEAPTAVASGRGSFREILGKIASRHGGDGADTGGTPPPPEDP
jgi:flagellar biogenesis protein FliO